MNISLLLSEGSRPLTPRPLPDTVRLPEATGALPVRPEAVFFDVYGTLFTCGGDSSPRAGAGDSPADEQSAGSSPEIDGLCRRYKLPCSGSELQALFSAAVLAAQEQARQTGVEHPDVKIDRVWKYIFDSQRWDPDQRRRRTAPPLRLAPRMDAPAAPGGGGANAGGVVGVAGIAGSGGQEYTARDSVIRRFSVEYELAVNPVWPMPGLGSTLQQLRDAGIPMGIVSNSKFFTPELFPALTGKTLTGWGFVPRFCHFSHESGTAKPGVEIFQQAATELARAGISPAKCFFVGSDMLCDCYASSKVGFVPVLFAGDGGSLRIREGDPRLGNFRPAAVVRSLEELAGLAGVAGT